MPLSENDCIASAKELDQFSPQTDDKCERGFGGHAEVNQLMWLITRWTNGT